MARSLAALLLLVAAVVAASAYQYPADSVASSFFLKKDLHPGSKMTLNFARAAPGAITLPRGCAESLPFSSARFKEILSRLSVPAGTPVAAAINFTLAQCDARPVPGVAAQRCATSVESMVDFAASSLGTREIRAMATKLNREEGEEIPRQEYTVESVSRPLPVPGGDMVACHCMPYPYAVFGCHTTTAAVYTAVLAGADGTKADALTACHKDASPGIPWPTYQKLGVTPGTVAVCHFLPQDSKLWMRN